MKTIIIEGPDNTGKSTLINYMCEHVPTMKLLHCGKPTDLNDPLAEQARLFTKMVDMNIRDYYSDAVDVTLYNRAWYGEYVYGPLYRKEDPAKVMRIIMELEHRMLGNIPADDVCLVLLTGSSDLLSRNEDGQSLSRGNKNMIDFENVCFNEIFSLSKLHKKIIKVDDDAGRFRTRENVLKEFLDFINIELL